MKKIIYRIVQNLSAFITCIVIAFSASAATDRYRLVLNNDPSSSISISFCASDLMPDYSKIKLYWGTTDFGINYLSYPNNKVPDRTTNYKDMRNGFFRLSGLTAKTRYYFVIVDANALVGGPQVSRRLFFETITNNPNDRLSIISGGDSRVYQVPFDPTILNAVCGTEDARKRANRLVAKMRVDAVWFNGDFTFSDNGPEWACWLNDWQLTISADGRMTPMVPAQGNHEVSLTVTGGSGAFADGASINMILDAANPTNANYYYALNFGGSLVRLYTLNTLISILGDQTDWLATDLAASNCSYRWKLAQYHFPIRPHNSGKDEQDDQRAAWCPLFEQYHVQLAIESDAHLFKYTKPIVASTAAGSDEGFLENLLKGTVYIGEGGWGAELRAADDNKDWTISSSSIFQFQWLIIDSGKLEVRTVLTDVESTVIPKTDTDNKFTPPVGMSFFNVPGMGTVYTLTNPHKKAAVNLGNDFSLCAGCTDTLDAGPGYASYLWSTGATSQSIIITTPGSYSVTVKDNWNCSASDQISVASVILPVRLLNIFGTVENGSNKISWNVSAEIKLKKYIVEKSAGPVTGFTAFDSITPAATSFTGSRSYSVIDKTNITGPITYYRLRMIDLDGQFGFSKTVFIFNAANKNPSFIVTPSMVVNQLDVRVGYFIGKTGKLSIIGAGGQTLIEQIISLNEAGVISLPVDVSHLPEGMYYAILQQADKRKWYRKFIKIKSR